MANAAGRYPISRPYRRTVRGPFRAAALSLVALIRRRQLCGNTRCRMKAMVVHNPRPIAEQPLTLVDLPMPEPQAGEVLVKVEVCGVCRTDLHVTEGDLPPH